MDEYDCCGCKRPPQFRAFYYEKSCSWLHRKLEQFACGVSCTLAFLRLANLLLMLYGLAVIVFCLLLLFGATWLPDEALGNGTYVDCPTETTKSLFRNGGYENLREGGIAFWVLAGVQLVVVFFFSPLFCHGHLNTICCSKRTLPTLRASAGLQFFLALCYGGLIAVFLIDSDLLRNVTVVEETVADSSSGSSSNSSATTIVATSTVVTSDVFPPWARCYSVAFIATLAADAAVLLLAFLLAESFRCNFLMVIVYRDQSKAGQRSSTHTKSRPSAVEMVSVGDNTKTDDRSFGEKGSSSSGGGGSGGGSASAGSAGGAVTVVVTTDTNQSKTMHRTWSEQIDAEGADAGKTETPAWEIPPEQIQNGDKIGEGFFGTCYKATWHHQLVVVKRFKNGIRGEGADAARRNFYREVGRYTGRTKKRGSPSLPACLPACRSLSE
jgi:hypothetical protein